MAIDPTTARAAILAKLGHFAPGGMLPLPEDHALFFKLDDPRMKLIPLANLSPTRAREDGIRDALVLMFAAVAGLPEKEALGKRDPISVSASAEGGYRIMDGNSTYHVAKESGWRVIPAIVSE